MKNNFYRIFAFLFLIGTLVVGCQENSDDPIGETEIIEDNALASKTIGDVFNVVNDFVPSKTAETCPVYTYEAGTLTADFGNGCVGGDAVTRKGVITAVFSNPTGGWQVEETATITFTDFYRNDKKLTGSVTITCTNLENPAFSVVANDMKLTFADSKFVTWSSNETISFVSAGSWKFNGTATGTNRSGLEYSRTSTNLISSLTCRWFVGGSLTLFVGDNTTTVTFTETCGTVKVKRNLLPEIQISI